MVCYLTSKRITYFLIIRQLRFDCYDFVASELERLFFNSLGNLDLSNIPPSDELQRIIGSNSVCTELLSNAKSSLDILTNGSKNGSPLRRPNLSNLSIDDDAYVVSQDNVSSLTTLLPDSSTEIETVQTTCSSSTVPPTEDSSETQVLKRGRTVKSSSSSSSALEQVAPDAPETEKILSELHKISQDLINEDKVSQEKPTNSFLSLKSSAVECDTVPKTSSTVAQDDTQTQPTTSQSELDPELPKSYTKFKIVRMTEDEDLDSTEPEPEIANKLDCGPRLTNNLYLSHKLADESQGPRGRQNRPIRTTSSSPERYPQHKPETRVLNSPHRASASGSSQPIQNNVVDSCSSKSTPAHRLNDNPDLLYLNYDNKLIVLNILAEGWKVHVAFEKRVRKEIPCAGKSSLEEILYAVFGYEASSFVEFRNEKKRMSIRLIPSYKPENFEAILAQ